MNKVTDHWLGSFTLNILAYSTLLLPLYLLVAYVKNHPNLVHKFKFLACCIRSCILGAEEVEDTRLKSVEEGTTPISPVEEKPSSSAAIAIKLVWCVIGLQVSYLTWGVIQERIMTREYEGETFTNSQFLVFVNRILALFVAGGLLMFRPQKSPQAPLYQFSFTSISNTLSSWCQYEALKFVSFPTLVLSKTCKSIPVMLMGKIISNKTYPYYEYAFALILSLGVSLFVLESETEGESGARETTFAGVIIIIGYLGFDSFTSNWQSEIYKQYKVSSVQMMYGVNLFSSLLTIISLVQRNVLFSSLYFLISHTEFALHCLILSICSAVGQLFIFYTIQEFGPFIFTIIMTLRQAFSILLSCIIYQHYIGVQGIVGIVVVFGAIGFRMYCNKYINVKN
ncbi:Adenosine 3'-phospho 5'-phosphosulfate transporter 1-like [Oopsacas minuta]|uniref:Adenosine 3'-phospho 5'-phosphosulfate transporter 1 n=1 Tax=Oopsacas minuta TaxID=111878 RepID=A0AAV7KDJ3_9METZ|nr:Adenosine 3'-phospho 5'-phosphosulfate transporter 1-like [Oopsacas minuta]